MTKKFDYSKSTNDIFFKVIYPLFAKEFMFGSDYHTFAKMVSDHFILNEPQWDYILEHWTAKEAIATLE